MSKLIGKPAVTGPWAGGARHKQTLVWQRPDERRYNPDPEAALQVIFVERRP